MLAHRWLQIEHLYFGGSCFILCLASFRCDLNFSAQISHTWLNSSKCVVSCSLRSAVRKNPLPQVVHMYFLTFKWTFLTCIFRAPWKRNSAGQPECEHFITGGPIRGVSKLPVDSSSCSGTTCWDCTGYFFSFGWTVWQCPRKDV